MEGRLGSDSQPEAQPSQGWRAPPALVRFPTVKAAREEKGEA